MSLGSMITKARKDAGLSIDDLSAATNIRATLLREMESDNFAQCGGETYARGHLRNLAQQFKIDPNIFITAFEDEQMHMEKSMQDLLVGTNAMREPAQVRKVSWRALVAISMATLLVAGIVQIVVSNSSTPVVPTAVEESTAPTQSAEPTAQPSAEASDAPVSTGVGVSVVITASRAKSWLFVSDASGKILFSGQVARGTTKEFSSSEQLNLKIGNAGGVDLVVNGESIESIGIDGEVVSVSYGVDS